MPPTSPGYGPFGRPVRWAPWWVFLWGVVAVGLLLAMALRASFWAWLPAAVVSFGTMEGFGLSSADDPYPPLTHVTREYSPRWLTFTLIYGAVGLGGGTWFHFSHRWWLALLTALAGWLTAHFDVTYDAAAVQQESTRYQWYAGKLHLRRFQARLAAIQMARTTG
ncbi:MAG TPA: hypothetical protein VFH45_00015 [Acidimicrobiales bacterium]|nr:hypothetical protein [Acidimicrobiales bacterium]